MNSNNNSCIFVVKGEPSIFEEGKFNCSFVVGDYTNPNDVYSLETLLSESDQEKILEMLQKAKQIGEYTILSHSIKKMKSAVSQLSAMKKRLEIV